MIIEELYIKNFGKFSNERIALGRGINILYGENERGKTTVYHFIKGMLFGIERQRGRASRNDVYSLYEPWENPAYYAGVIRFSIDSKMFRLERSFSKNQKSVQLVCETDGEELSVEHGDLDMLLDGLKEETFDSTVSIGQLKAKSGESLAGELKNAAANYYDTGDFELNIEEALASLNDKKKEFRRKIKAAQESEEITRKNIISKTEIVKADIQKAQDELTYSRTDHQNSMNTPQNKEIIKRPLLIPGIVLAAVSVCIAFLLSFHLYALLAAGAGVAAGLFMMTRKKAEVLHAPVKREETGAKHREYLEEFLKEKQTALANFYETLDEMEEVSEEVKSGMAEIEAIDLAVQTIGKVSSETRKEQGGQLNKRVSEIFGKLTGGKYESLFVDENLSVKVNTPDKLVRTEQLSQGTLEQIYFALRMAAADILFPDSQVPVIFDDTFAMYDEKRLESALKWLFESKRQVLLFTCHKREIEILNKLNIPHVVPWQ